MRIFPTYREVLVLVCWWEGVEIFPTSREVLVLVGVAGI